jgi:hypothetical protein
MVGWIEEFDAAILPNVPVNCDRLAAHFAFDFPIVFS